MDMEVGKGSRPIEEGLGKWANHLITKLWAYETILIGTLAISKRSYA